MNFQKLSSPRLRQNISAISIGALAFLYFANWRFLDIKNVGWLFSGANTDKASAYLGWEFFRKTQWTIPLGQNESFGLLPSNSIAYSDSIPLLAIIFKLFNSNLGTSFQYFGIWLLACFVLQSLFTALILRMFTEDYITIVVSCCLSVMIPFFLQRVPIHLALSGQFLILASFYLILRSRKEVDTRLAWLILNACSLMIHPYLFVSVFAIYGAQLLDLYCLKLQHKRAIFFGAFINAFTLAIICRYVLGISLSNQIAISETPYGAYPWNLLSLFNPRDWPRFLTFYPARDSSFETFSYPGLGILLILLLATVLAIKDRRFSLGLISKYASLASVSVVLLLFAITNRVGIGDLRINIFDSSLIEEKLSMFRASARMAWPFVYALIFASIIFVIKKMGKKKSIPILLFSLAIQFADVRVAPDFLFPQNGEKYVYTSPSIDPEWMKVKGKYKRIVVLPSPNSDFAGWPEMAIVANEIGAETNAAYVARFNSDELKTVKNQIVEAINSGNYDSESIYVIYSDSKIKIDGVSAADRLWFLEGKIVILPDWYRKTNS